MWEWDKRIREWENVRMRVESCELREEEKGRRGGISKKLKLHIPSSISKLFLDNSTYAHTHTQMNFKDTM